VTLAVSGINDPSGSLEADRAAAEHTLQDKMDKYRWYPVLSVGASYSF
jgi:hypothetical protein